MRDPRRVMAATVLVFEALVVVFAALVAKDLSDLSATQAVVGGAVLALVLGLSAGLLSRPGGYWWGSFLQLVVLGTALLLPAMLVVGLLFAGLWAGALVLGARIERDRERFTAPGGPGV